MRPERTECLMRNPENGNCGPAGGFCTANRDEICAALHSAYDRGFFNGTEAAKKTLPTRGHWVMLSYDEAVCSCCGYDRNTPFDSTREAKERWSELPPYCEMCGAFLKEETNGKTDDPQF